MLMLRTPSCFTYRDASGRECVDPDEGQCLTQGQIAFLSFVTKEDRICDMIELKDDMMEPCAY